MIRYPKKLTKENFTCYGDVIEVNDNNTNFPINDGYSQRYHNIASIDVNKNEGKASINIFRSTPLTLPIKVEKMERHPLSSQSFIPLGEQPYLVIVAPAGSFDETSIEVFLASSNQGINYFAGTWHHYSLALNQQSDFLVIDRIGEGENCDVVSLRHSIQVDLVK